MTPEEMKAARIMPYQALLDGLDGLVFTDHDGHTLSGDPAHRLFMVQRGKHYNETQAREVVSSVANDLRSLADELDALNSVC